METLSGIKKKLREEYYSDEGNSTDYAGDIEYLLRIIKRMRRLILHSEVCAPPPSSACV